METAIVKRFLDFFQDFINLCQQENWPSNETTETEIQHSFLIAKHVENCLDKFQKRGLIDEFLSTLNNNQDVGNIFFKSCLSDPPKFILKKIIQSETKLEIMDKAFKLFLAIFSEEKLELCLTDLIVESASTEVLLQNLTATIPREHNLKFKSEILLSELSSCSNQTVYLQDLLNNCNQSTIELLVICLSNKDFKYMNAVDKILEQTIDVMLRKNTECKKFWHYIFSVEEKYLIDMCLQNDSLFTYMCKALLDCGKLIREQMSTEYFYIDINYSELCRILGIIYKYDMLKSQFFDVVKATDGDMNFWLNLVK